MAKLVIVGHFEALWLEMIQKIANLGKFANALPRNGNFEIWQKMSHLVGKDWKSCELGEIGHFKPIRATSVANVQWQNWPLWIILRHFSWKLFKKLQIWENWPQQK